MNREEQRLQFLSDIEATCKKHGMYLRKYHVDYDEYDSDEGYEIVKKVEDSDLWQMLGANYE